MDERNTVKIPLWDLRDVFAGQAMAALIASPLDQWPEDILISSISEAAYELADAMLAAREKKEG